MGLFADLPVRTLPALSSMSSDLDVMGGRVLATPGAAARALLILLEGYAVADDGCDRVILGPWSAINHDALLTRSPVRRCVVTLSPIRVLHFDARAFRSACEAAPVLEARLKALIDLQDTAPAPCERVQPAPGSDRQFA